MAWRRDSWPLLILAMIAKRYHLEGLGYRNRAILLLLILLQDRVFPCILKGRFELKLKPSLAHPPYRLDRWRAPRTVQDER